MANRFSMMASRNCRSPLAGDALPDIKHTFSPASGLLQFLSFETV